MKNEDRMSLGWQVFLESNDAIFITTIDNIVCDVNPFAERMSGFSRSDLLERSVFEIVSSFGETTLDDVLNALNETGLFHSRERFLLQRHNKSELPVNLSVSRIHVASQVFGLVIARDISERVENDIRLREAHTHLEHQVAERTAELQMAHDNLLEESAKRQQSQEELVEVNRQLANAIETLRMSEEHAVKNERLRIAGQLASGIAHDINNSITPVLLLADFLFTQSDLTDVQTDYVSQIKQCAVDVGATVHRLREITKGEREIRRTSVSLPELLDGVMRIVQSKLIDERRRNGKQIRIEFGVLEEITLCVDESEIRTLVTNLVLNAIDAIHQSGRIELACCTIDDEVIISVSDDGEGMSKEQLERCFEFFVTTRSNGCGLGLSLCQRIAEQHNGRIDIESTPCTGTSVRVTLPNVPNSEAISNQPAHFAKSRFLVVEDDEMVRKSISLLLSTKGMDVDSVDSSHAALERLRRSEYDVIVSDFSLPGMNGRELLGECRSKWPHLRTVLISGWIDAPHEPSDKSPHFFMNKPLQVDELLERLADMEG